MILAFMCFMSLFGQSYAWEVLDSWSFQEAGVVYLKDKGSKKFLFSGYDNSGEFLMIASALNLKPENRPMKLEINCCLYERASDKVFITFFDLDNVIIANYSVKFSGKVTVSLPLNELRRIRYFSWSYE